MKKALGLVVMAAAAAGVIAYLTREQMLPAPATNRQDPPSFRPGATDISPESAPEDLTEIKGIGPTYASRLADMAISTRAQLVAADATAVAAGVGTSVTTVEGWQAAAAT